MGNARTGRACPCGIIHAMRARSGPDRSWVVVVVGVVVLLLSQALTALDGFLLLLAIAFGPSGFGGDANPNPSRVANSQRGEWAGLVALLLDAVVVAMFLALRRDPHRRLLVLVGCLSAQIACLVVFVVTNG